MVTAILSELFGNDYINYRLGDDNDDSRFRNHITQPKFSEDDRNLVKRIQMVKFNQISSEVEVMMNAMETSLYKAMTVLKNRREEGALMRPNRSVKFI